MAKKNGKVSKLISCIVIVITGIMINYSFAGANNCSNTYWSIDSEGGGVSLYTSAREKTDISKCFVQNNSGSAGSIYVTIYGGDSRYGVFTNCTYNTSSAFLETPFTVTAGHIKYCSNTVYEEYAPLCYAKLKISVYLSGFYNGYWSPDNYNKY